MQNMKVLTQLLAAAAYNYLLPFVQIDSSLQMVCKFIGHAAAIEVKDGS